MPPISPMSLWLKSKCIRVRFSFSASANALASLSVRWFASKDQIKLSQTSKYIVHLEYTYDEEGYKRAGQGSRPYSQNSGLTWRSCMAKSNENSSFDQLLGFGKSIFYSHLNTSFVNDWFFNNMLAKAIPPSDRKKFSDKFYQRSK